MGHCDKRTGLCKCRDGFYGGACSYSRCPRSLTSTTTAECSGHGRCMTLHEAAQETNHVSLLHSFAYTHWDAHRIQGCICDLGFMGGDCSLRVCPKGDDPGSSDQVNEIQLIQCAATSGTFTVTFREHATAAIAYNANAADIKAALEALDTIVDVTVAVYDNGGSTAGSTVACDSNGQTIKITFNKNPGNLPPLILGSAGLSATNTLLLKESGASSTYTGSIASVTGTKEEYECSNRGVCNRLTGECVCHPFYASSDGAGAAGNIPNCGHLTGGTSPACLQIGALGGNECGGGHGTCTRTGSTSNYYCSSCDNGYAQQGNDCSWLSCPTSRAWFSEASGTNAAHELMECGGVGHCDRTTGECKCMTLGAFTLSSNQLFEGTACGRLACPYNSTSSSACGGKGSCLSMSQWAAKATDGQGTVLGLSYSGSTSEDAWDHSTMQGCYCTYKPEENTPYASQMYTGPLSWGTYPLRSYDCSKASCAVGDNPDTLDQFFEVQKMTCDATGGTFTLSFRGFTSGAISWNAVAMISDENTGSTAGIGVGESLQQKLHDMFSIHPMCFAGTCTGMSVTYSTGTAACKAGGSNVVSLEFQSELGDVPILTAVTSSLTGTKTIAIVEYTRGNKETAFCSEHGICDSDKGTCLCHKGYTSSDGSGGPGQRGDCGFRTMFATVDNAFNRYQGGVASLVTQVTSFVPNTDSAL